MTDELYIIPFHIALQLIFILIHAAATVAIKSSTFLMCNQMKLAA